MSDQPIQFHFADILSLHKYCGSFKAMWQNWLYIGAINKVVWSDGESKLYPLLFMLVNLWTKSCKVKLISKRAALRTWYTIALPDRIIPLSFHLTIVVGVLQVNRHWDSFMIIKYTMKEKIRFESSKYTHGKINMRYVIFILLQEQNKILSHFTLPKWMFDIYCKEPSHKVVKHTTPYCEVAFYHGGCICTQHYDFVVLKNCVEQIIIWSTIIARVVDMIVQSTSTKPNQSYLKGDNKTK